jgi:hypothetical protein
VIAGLSGDKNKLQFSIQESIKEVDENSHQDDSEIIVGGGNGGSIGTIDSSKAKKRRGTLLSGSQQEFIRDLVEKLWDNYDTDGSGVLDKIETANFLNEILSAQGQGPPSMEQFKHFFQEFDTNKDGVIQKGEMASFIKRFLLGHVSG